MLGIVLINYKSEKETIQYVSKELSKLSYPNVITIVNNSYSESSDEQIKNRISNETDRVLGKDIFVITKNENLGYARANNFGATFLKSKFQLDYLLFSNTDIVFTDTDVVDKLIHQLQILPKEVAVVGPRVVGLDGKDQSPHAETSFKRYFAWKAFPFLRGQFKFLQKKKNETSYILKNDYCYWVSGCFMLVKAKDFF
jgi:GT2 family glycosyltransferase